ncbi:hypothetical protein Q4574_12560 [Aliiglaciecola sp. 3_MG-2023]|uniref:hypothetical protein n=1 Tax=Aliiglaciecola sp. 3_MG-2023 TaxID=3062644 RepID=UPI0026E2166A|nr:hypothetical protein [Aliiglaciecola sp. 3_MG-2023]MDO6694116.1 hypothetical protein [Aliiglaciecola sp. 3_MG-2023]
MGIKIKRCLLFIFTLLSFCSSAACRKDVHRQFDFWLGTWDVYSTQGKIVGVNKITQLLDGCSLKEEYQTPSGYQGQSINIYDTQEQQWHQTWVDNQGLLLLLKGKFDGHSMILTGEGQTSKGEKIMHKITWTPRTDETDKIVRQHWQSSQDNGETWSTLFDGKYVKRKK